MKWFIGCLAACVFLVSFSANAAERVVFYGQTFVARVSGPGAYKAVRLNDPHKIQGQRIRSVGLLSSTCSGESVVEFAAPECTSVKRVRQRRGRSEVEFCDGSSVKVTEGTCSITVNYND